MRHHYFLFARRVPGCARRAALLLGLSGLAPGAGAQALDPSFAPTRVYAPGTVFSAVEQADSKRVVAGSFTRVNGAAAAGLSRFNADGTLDAAFQQRVGPGPAPYRIRKAANGQFLLSSFYLTGTITAGGITRQEPLRLNADGTGDAAFNAGTGAKIGTAVGSGGGYVDDMLPLPGGQTVVVGYFDHFNGSAAPDIVRLTATGAVDPGFSAGQGVDVNAGEEVFTAVPLANGQLLIGGYFTTYDGHACNGLARLNANGGFDAAFGQVLGANSEVDNVLVQPDGKLLVAGSLQMGANSIALIRLLPTGAVDPAFAAPAALQGVASFTGDALQLQPDGKILFLSSSAGAGAPRVGRLNADGTPDATFQAGPGPNTRPNTLALLAGGQVLVGGSFTNFSGVLDRPLVQLTSAGTVDAAFQPVVQAPGAVAALVRQPDGKLVAGGNFSEINGQAVRRLARFTAAGALDPAFALPNPDENVADLALQPDGRLLAASAGSLRRYLPTGAFDSGFAPATGRFTRILLQPDGRVLAGGNGLTSAGGFRASGLLRLLPDGTHDASFAPSANTPGSFMLVQTMALQPNGQVLVAGTVRAASGGIDPQTVQRLNANGALDASFTGSEFGGTNYSFGLNSLAVQPDGKAVVGGFFTSYGPTALTGLARLNADGTLDAGFAPPALAGAVNTVLLQPNNRLLLGGAFSGPGLPNNLARLLPTGAADASFGAGAAPDGPVNALLVQPDGALVLGGGFAAVGGQAAQALARLTGANALAVAAPRAVADRTAAWPVPAHTVLHVAPDAAAHPRFVDVLDVLGRSVLHQRLDAAPASLRVEGLPAGAYLLRVTYAEGLVVRRIQVE